MNETYASESFVPKIRKSTCPSFTCGCPSCAYFSTSLMECWDYAWPIESEIWNNRFFLSRLWSSKRFTSRKGLFLPNPSLIYKYTSSSAMSYTIGPLRANCAFSDPKSRDSEKKVLPRLAFPEKELDFFNVRNSSEKILFEFICPIITREGSKVTEKFTKL